VAEWATLTGVTLKATPLGVRGYQSSGDAGELLAHVRLDAAGIAERARRLAREI
jgi:transketolase C-terminal domain/subunit